MDYSLALAPLIPDWLLYAAGGLAQLAALAILFGRGPAPLLRTAALALVVAALANPVLRQEERDPLPGVAVIVADASASQRIDNRDTVTGATEEALYARLAREQGLEVRRVQTGDTANGTELFSSLERTLADVPADRIAGVFMITDGQVHDAADRVGRLGFSAPVHTLLTGRENETDRRIVVQAQPRFGIVNTEQPITFKVEDLGTEPAGPQRVAVTISRDGETLSTKLVTIGDDVTVPVTIAHGGRNLFEIAVEPLEGELTEVNNRAVIETDGIRENLRVLLVSGEPHAGERTWRNTLKSDAAVDLVHFTILRPPDKQDGTPISELALIAFPTRELFSEKIDDFDLIIFDRYARLGVLPSLYFDNIADYVRKGGALLVASGPEYAGGDSLFRTPLANVLPAVPTGNVSETPFRPGLSEDGRKHPITRELDGARADPPRWGRWFRLVEAEPREGRVLLSGDGGKPLLITAQAGKGRVAVMLSDQTWLWARGFEGGGPYVDLLRRLGHWLMRESALEEEQLSITASGSDLVVERRTMADAVSGVAVTTPTGQQLSLELEKTGEGLWTGRIANPSPGIWRAADGNLTAIADAGPDNGREFADVRSTRDLLEPIARASGGGIQRIGEGGAETLPRIVSVRAGATASGSGWMGIVESRASILRATSTFPLLAGLAGLLLLISAISAMWYRERG